MADRTDSPPSDFIRDLVREDLAAGRHQTVRTRFPPEPNGYLHIGHAKSIWLNFGLAAEVPDGACNLRFDDTNPLTEDPEYVASIQDDVRWLGADWEDRLFFASDYFGALYDYAEELIRQGLAYVDSSSEEEIRARRGTVTEPGVDSPFRDRSMDENLDLFRRMRAGEFEDGAHVLRARIDMAHPNMKMRDPLLYRIRHATHYRTGDDWCIYPFYDFTHCLSDSLEGITHSLCTLEFENNREIYDWILDHLDVPQPQPRQTEFARLNLNYTVLSKRKLLELVQGGHVEGWDDPRMPTLSGLRRRGYTPAAIRSFCDRIGVAKANSTVDVALLEHSIRDDLNHQAPRVMVVLRPLEVLVTNYREGQSEELPASYWPHDVPREGSRPVPFSRRLYIERDDFREDPPKRFHRLAPGREVRLRYGYVLRCDEVVKDEAGEVVRLLCSYDPATVGGATPDGRRVKGTIHWVSADHACPARVRLYDRLFRAERPGAEGEDFKSSLNPDSFEEIPQAWVEPSLGAAEPGSRYQFERLGYFFRDPATPAGEPLTFNRIVTLRDTWAKISAGSEPRGAARAEVPSAPKPPAPAAPKDPWAGVDSSQRERMAHRVEVQDLAAAEARLLTDDPAWDGFFESAAAAAGMTAPAVVAKWILNELRGQADGSPADLPFSAAAMGELVRLVDGEEITAAAAKEVLAAMIAGEGGPGEIVAARGLSRLTDPQALARLVDEVLAAETDHVAAYREGKTALFGYFVGQVMKRSRGRAQPQQVQALLRRRLD